MLRRSLVRWCIAAGLLCALSCSLVVDTSDVDQGCGPDRKLCDGKCVGITEAAYGCTRDGCAPCRLTNALPRCNDGACVVDACLFGFDCPEEKTGCLINILVDSAHCGNCAKACDEGMSCSNGTCVGGQAGSTE